jgi:hypothetical protein
VSICPHPDCDRTIPSTMFACRPHWYSLPPFLRSKIWRNYQSGEMDRILSGYDEAEQFWTAAP